MMKPVIYTVFALLCFALNSLLCRLALRAGEIDAASFTLVRLAAGAAALFALRALVGRRADGGAARAAGGGSWPSAALLFGYAICFSLAYRGLSAATGALVLFGAVQLAMVGAALLKGERPRAREWLGLALALGGLVYLLLPGLEAPPPASAALMVAAGAAWGFYTLRGRASADPLGETAGNFARAAPFALAAALPFAAAAHASAKGAALAALSGALASGAGYAVWYAALRYLAPTRAAALQLAVPALTAFGGVVLLGEAFTPRLALASALILGGIGLVIAGRRK